MAYDLRPRNKDISPISIGWPLWHYILLETGIGLVIGVGNSIRPAQYRYIPANNGASPMSNDGYHVQKKDALLMAAVANGWVLVESGKRIEWEELSEEERKRMEEWNKEFKTYKLPASKELIENVAAFSNFAETSGGFRIY